MRIPLGAWMPDQPDLNNTCTVATNIYPTAQGYKPFKGPEVISTALTGQCLGAITFRRQDGEIETFAGDATKLYRLGSLTMNDVSNGTYSSLTKKWRFAIYGDIVIATNNIDAVQQFDLSTDSAFSDLTAAPVHSFPFIVRDFLVACDVNDGTVFQLKWSARNNSAKWDADCGGGAQQFPDGGPLVGAVGGEVGVILQTQAITRMIFVGGDLRFAFDKLEGARGCISAGSIVQFGGLTFYLSEAGFEVFDGATSQSISDKTVANTFFTNLDRSKIDILQGALDLDNKCIVWAYPTSSASAGKTDRQIIFNFAENKWSETTQVTQTVLEDEISPNLLSNDAGAERDYLGGQYFYYTKELIANLNLSTGDTISYEALTRSSDGTATGQRLRVDFFNSSTASTGVSGTPLNSSSVYVRGIQTITIPADTVTLDVYATHSVTNTSTAHYIKEASLNKSASSRRYGDSDGKVLACFDTNNKLARYTGSNLAPTMTTGEHELSPGRKTRLRSARAVIDAPHTVAVGHRNTQSASVTTESAVAANANGKSNIRVQDRYSRFTLSSSAGANWTEATGIDVDGIAGGV